MSTGLAASTVTPGITEPCASLTTPLIDAPSWACATNGLNRMTSESKSHRPRMLSSFASLPTPPVVECVVLGGLGRYAGLHGFGLHFDASDSRRKCELVTRRPSRYSGSTTCVVTTNHSEPSGTGKRSKNSVTVVFSLWGTPLRPTPPPPRLRAA